MSLTILRLQDVRRLLRLAEEYELSSAAVQRLKWFQYNLEHDGNVSLTCRHFGISRSTYLRWAERFDATDIRTLEEFSRRPHSVRAPETDENTVQLIKKIRMEQPLLGKEAVTNILKQQYNITISSSTVGRIIKRHSLFFATTESHLSKRAVTEESSVVRLASPEKVSGDAEADIDDPFLSLVSGITS